jgi:dephospho-CoA kinase
MIIGLSGYAQSGKDTTAKILIDEFGFNRVAFADKIRLFLLEINPLLSDGYPLKSVVNEYGWDVAKSRNEVRRLMQETGVAARNLFDQDFWVNAAFKDLDPVERVVVTDVRFRNEADYIKELGGYVWRISRSSVEAVNNHVSENDLDNYFFDAVITNNSTIEDLHKNIRNLLISYLK